MSLQRGRFLLLAAGLWMPMAGYAGIITLSTTPNFTNVTLGSTTVTLEDTAVLAGGDAPTGTITYTLYHNETLVDTETVTVDGNGTYLTPVGFTLPPTGTVTGTYQWDAAYSGDMDNNSVTENNNLAEEVSVFAATPGLNTTPGLDGDVMTDSAILTGSYGATGTITFQLYGPTSALLDTETEPVSGNGSYSTPTGYVFSSSGTYQWEVTYNGDSNNNAVSGQPEVEVIAPEPSSMALCGLGVGVLMWRRNRRARRSA